MKKANLFFFLIISFYGLLYIATSVNKPCDGDCEKIRNLSNFFLKDSNYIYPPWPCGIITSYDTLCVNIKDTTARDWNLLADSICVIATQDGLPKRQIFIINNFNNVPDTIVKKSCP